MIYDSDEVFLDSNGKRVYEKWLLDNGCNACTTNYDFKFYYDGKCKVNTESN